MNTILKLEHIQKYYGNEGNITKAIKDISFSVEAGEFLGIMGARRYRIIHKQKTEEIVKSIITSSAVF